MELHIGTYAEPGGPGLVRLVEANGGWALGEAYRDAPNASFGAFSPRYGLYYLVDEREEGALRVLRRDGSTWQPLARVPTGGAQPCYVSLSPDETWLAVANYGSGSVTLFRLDPDTGLPGAPAVHANRGHGPVAERQEGPHAHCVVFSREGNWLYQTDLGTDQILAFALDGTHGIAGEPRVAFAAPAGSGPRHLLFHPSQPIALLVSELSSTLTVLDIGHGTLTPRQTVSTLPGGFAGESLGGHLALNAAGDRAYVTNRGHDSIATFAVATAGGVSLLGHTPAGGASPRFLLLLEAERRMVIANEEGNSVTILALGDDGVPVPSAEIAVTAPAFVFDAAPLSEPGRAGFA